MITLTHTICLQSFRYGYSTISKRRGKVQFKLGGEIRVHSMLKPETWAFLPSTFCRNLSLSTSLIFLMGHLILFTSLVYPLFLLFSKFDRLSPLFSFFSLLCPQFTYLISAFSSLWLSLTNLTLGPTIHLLYIGMRGTHYNITHKSHPPYPPHTPMFKFKNSTIMK